MTEETNNQSTALTVIPKTKLGRRCSICFHLEVDRINKLIRSGESTRTISCQIVSNDSMRESIRRHTENCLKLDIRALVEDKRLEQAIEHYLELKNQLEFAKALQEACRELLVDVKSGKISLAPRDYEVEVMYLDYNDLTVFGAPRRKKEKLSDIIVNIQKIHTGFMPLGVGVKTINYFDAAVKTIDAIDKVLDKFAKVDGHYQKERENDEALARVSKALLAMLEHLQKDGKQVDPQYWLEHFAEKSGVDIKRLSDRTGIEIKKTLI